MKISTINEVNLNVDFSTGVGLDKVSLYIRKTLVELAYVHNFHCTELRRLKPKLVYYNKEGKMKTE